MYNKYTRDKNSFAAMFARAMLSIIIVTTIFVSTAHAQNTRPSARSSSTNNTLSTTTSSTNNTPSSTRSSSSTNNTSSTRSTTSATNNNSGASATDGALILEHAGSNENIYHSATGEFISFLRGDVVFRYEDIRMSADSAVWRRNDGIIDFTGNVTVEQRGQLLTCGRMLFVRGDNMLTATENVLYRDSARVTFIRGDTADYLTNENEALLYGSPLLTRVDGESADTMFLRGRLISYNDSTKIAIVTDSVRVEMGSLLATGEIATYFTSGDKATLRVNPVIYYDGHRIVGDSVDLFIGGEHLESAVVVGNTHGFYKSFDTIPPPPPPLRSGARMTARSSCMTSRKKYQTRRSRTFGATVCLYRYRRTAKSNP